MQCHFRKLMNNMNPLQFYEAKPILFMPKHSPAWPLNLWLAESERSERERKGDLDQYERLDGDRNITSEYLAVKKVCNVICSLTNTWWDTRNMTIIVVII